MGTKTEKFNLNQIVATDTPDWLTTYNEDMAEIEKRGLDKGTYDPTGKNMDVFRADSHVMTGYVRPTEPSNVIQNDTVSSAIGKIETRAIQAGDMRMGTYDKNKDGKVDAAEVADVANSVQWGSVVGRPTTMPNDSALSVQYDGKFIGSYDGSQALTLNVTADEIGAASLVDGKVLSGQLPVSDAIDSDSSAQVATSRAIKMLGNSVSEKLEDKLLESEAKVNNRIDQIDKNVNGENKYKSYVLSGGNLISSGANCNTLPIGICWSESTTKTDTIINKPPNVAGRAIIITESANGQGDSAKWFSQKWVSVYHGQTYSRYNEGSDSSWTDWSCVTPTDKMYPVSSGVDDLGRATNIWNNLYVKKIELRNADVSLAVFVDTSYGYAYLRSVNGSVATNYILDPETGSLWTSANGTGDLGKSIYRWKTGYFSSDISVSSDRNLKHDIVPLDPDLNTRFITALSASSYKYNNGTSGRKHWGLTAQDVECALHEIGLTAMDFAGLMIDHDEQTERDEYSLRYGEFIAPIICELQSLRRELEELKKRQ